MYKLYFTKEAQKDANKIRTSDLKNKIEILLKVLEVNPFQEYPSYKKLKGRLEGAYSRRINLQHRLFYEVDVQNKRVKVLRMWTHYGDN